MLGSGRKHSKNGGDMSAVLVSRNLDLVVGVVVQEDGVVRQETHSPETCRLKSFFLPEPGKNDVATSSGRHPLYKVSHVSFCRSGSSTKHQHL